jgi:lipopolysaccharide/colanic/teichoic acid biosynthesis glycosyltransferase
MRTRHRRRFRWLPVADAAVVLGTVVGTSLIRFDRLHPRSYPVWQYALGYAAVVVIHVAVYYFGGLYEPEERLGVRAWMPRAVAQTAFALLLDALAALLTGRYFVPRFDLLVLAVVAPVGLAANRALARAARWRRFGRPRVALVGAVRDRELARAHLPESDRAAIVVVELDDADDLLHRVQAAGATDVLLLSADLLDAVFPEPLATFERARVGCLCRVSARETLLGLREVREVSGMPFVPLRQHALPVSRARFKRSLELVSVVLVAPIAAVLIGATALYVLVRAGWPIFYRQPRVGKDGRVFTMVKFRTMVRDAEDATGAVLARERDGRVERGCGWLRRTRLDELPQLAHVARGTMSIVGPRPERPELASQFAASIPGYERRWQIPPGITGLAQVRGRYHTDPEYKLGYDLQYLVNWSPVLDAEIVVRTIWVVVAGRV